MSLELQEAKAELRRAVRARLKGMTAQQRSDASARARALLQRQPLWQEARSILFFAPLPGELHVWPLLAEAFGAGKSVGLPRFSESAARYIACEVRDCERDLATGRYGIREPAATCAAFPYRVDLVLVPGVAFDLEGGRLGRGKGYYDRMLAELSGTTCGVAFDEQIIPEVPVEAHDRHVNYLLTPTRWVQINSKPETRNPR